MSLPLAELFSLNRSCSDNCATLQASRQVAIEQL